ncbi:hypothetical protein KC368_g62 [Hortaea werneckii]|nr:hypothetical protein KC368_g62 [Hortaea werneckii]
MQTSRRLNAEENDQDKTLLGLSRFTANVQLDPQCSATGSGGTRQPHLYRIHNAKMKFPLLAGICLVSARTIDEVQCQKKNGDLTTMIHQFCNNRKIVVPGWYAEQGVRRSSS